MSTHQLHLQKEETYLLHSPATCGYLYLNKQISTTMFIIRVHKWDADSGSMA